jgi:hypothetical protein
MSDERCTECSKPIRIVSLGTWNGVRFPIDFTPTSNGEYAVLGPDTAAYVSFDRRSNFEGTLYADHRRTCPKRKADDLVDRPLFANVNIRCDSCQSTSALSPEADAARDGAEKFIADHINCRKRRAS